MGNVVSTYIKLIKPYNQNLMGCGSYAEAVLVCVGRGSDANNVTHVHVIKNLLTIRKTDGQMDTAYY